VLSFAHIVSAVIARGVPLPREHASELREALKRLTELVGREVEKLHNDSAKLEQVLHLFHALIKTWIPMGTAYRSN